MKPFTRVLFLGLVVGSSACGNGCKPSAPPVGLEVGDQGPLTFPPPDVGWVDRNPIPGHDLRKNEWSPTFDIARHRQNKDGLFEFEGQSIYFDFGESVAEAKDLKKAPAIKITPAVAGKTVWSYGSHVTFEAAKPFDPEAEYTAELPELTSVTGRKLEGGALKVKFRADPSILIAGKTIHYMPKKGEARVVFVKPYDETEIGATQDLAIVFDQPIEIGLAQKLVTMKGEDEKAIPLALRHPTEGVLEGEKVDPRLVVFARAQVPPKPGTKLVFTAKDEKEPDTAKNDKHSGDGKFERTYTVAEPLKYVGLRCGYNYEQNADKDCETQGEPPAYVKTGNSRIALQFNNTLGIPWGEGKKFLQATPEIKNLTTDGYGKDFNVSGSFTPSTKYTLRFAGLHDQHGQALAPLTVTFETRPLTASVAMPEDVTVLDVDAVKAFAIATRNVEEAELRLFALPKGDVPAFRKALTAVHQRRAPEGTPITVVVRPNEKRDEMVQTLVDLSAKVELDRAYAAELHVKKALYGALNADEAAKNGAKGRDPYGILLTAGKDALAAHVHQSRDKAAVVVVRLGSGEPVAGATVAVGAVQAKTDATGSAMIAVPKTSAAEEEPIVHVVDNGAEVFVPMTIASSTKSAALFAALGHGSTEVSNSDLVGAIVTDRGIYRPNTTIQVKAFVRKMDDAKIKPVPSSPVRLRLVDPYDTDVVNVPLKTNDRGVVIEKIDLKKTAHTGRFHLRLEEDDARHTVLADELVRVLEFEAPKFKVDVEAKEGGAAGKLRASVVGTYLFGAPMAQGKVAWTLKKSALPVKGGVLGDLGLSFTDYSGYYWDDFSDGDSEKEAADASRPMAGEGELDAQGVLALDVATGPLLGGPTELVLEADVTDASYRHIAGQLRTTRDPYAVHVGMKLGTTFGGIGPVRADLGAVDRNGKALSGVKVKATLQKVKWTRAAERAESAAVIERWKYTYEDLGTCEAVTTGDKPVPCELAVDKAGDYRIVASADGASKASVSYYAWSGERGVGATPGAGKKLPVLLDKKSYKAGETAKVLVQNPWNAALALLTVEQGGIVRHESRRIEGPSATFDVAVTGAHAPFAHAVVTLLPIGEREADYRTGAVRFSVGMDEARLSIAVASDKKAYEVKETAEITIDVKRGGKPVKDADVTLAVVDEGVLRLTAFHVKDLVQAFRPGRPLDFAITDSRAFLMSRKEKAHAAGGGDSAGEDAIDTRKNFVETAAWEPKLSTDGDGKVKVKVKLPDNLTEFRMMAAVVDDDGSGGTAEAGFVVNKPILLEPVMPRFAMKGDSFEAAAMVHNNTDQAVSAKVTVAGQDREVSIPARGRTRVAVPMTADKPGKNKMAFAVETGGAVRDRVEIPFVVDEPGIDERPALSGTLLEKREIALEIPADAIFDREEAYLSIKTGSALYPELGQRIGYLLDYPHGCVEQATSGMLPLLAAKTLLPWAGVAHMDDSEIEKRIKAGVDRLALMTTSTGGLAYWPGGTEPNTYGTAYAARALLGAKALGIEKPGLLDGVLRFLESQLGDVSEGEMRVAIAAVLAEAKKLPPESADSLWDKRDKLSPFATAELAIALSAIPKQEDRVAELVGKIEGAFEANGDAKAGSEWGKQYHYYWYSSDRERAAAVMALTRLKKTSPLLPVLAQKLVRGVERYNTQSVAWSLLAVSEFVGDRKASGSVDVEVKIDDSFLKEATNLGGDNKEVRIPLRDLAGKKRKLILTGDKKLPSAFSIDTRYKRPLLAAGSRVARRAPKGMSIHRVYSDATGKPLDLTKIKAGSLVRVAVRADVEHYTAREFIALTDRVPAGFEVVNTDLATTAAPPALPQDHPFFGEMQGWGASSTHKEIRDNRIELYYDQVYESVLYASYYLRATTPGTFVLPPAHGELMYEADSEGYTDSAAVVVVP